MAFVFNSKEEAKRKISELVSEYILKIKDKEYSINERNTESFVERIFHILNWNIDDFDQFVRRDSVKIGDKTKIPDYTLYIHGERQLVIEVKAFSESLDNPAYIKQALDYGYYKQVRICILTNGKQIKVYDPYISSKSQESKLLFSINIEQYESLFEERIWLLSQEEIKNKNVLAKFAKAGEVKRPVDEEVIDNIIQARKLLIDSIRNLNNIEDLTLIRTYAHKILNRFLFIRAAEDKGFFKEFDHGRILADRVRIFQKKISQRIKPLMEELKELFNEIDDVYNGELFKPDSCERLKVDNKALEQAVNLMYFIKHKNGEEDEVDFSKLDADVLGRIYEKFLGTIIYESKTGKIIEKVSTDVIRGMGTYYTPPFIVNFIVKNTLTKALDKEPEKLFSLKLVDPSCGSGAFLIRAFDELYDRYADFNAQQDVKKKTGDLKGYLDDKSVCRVNEVILHKHIHGIDLDPEAVELAKINLWLRTIQENMKLNELDKNIKQGNSLINSPIAGKNSFDWDKQYPFKFDFIIGNPPWISLKGKHKNMEVSDEELKYYIETYHCDTYMPNTYELFIRKGFQLLNKDGYFSFIVPDRLCANQQFIELRKYILENFTIKNLWFKVKFPGIIADTVIFVIQNKKPQHNIIEIKEGASNVSYSIPQEVYLNSSDFAWFFIKQEILDIFNKIKSHGAYTPLIHFLNTKTTSGCGAKSHLISTEKNNERQILILKGESINRWIVNIPLWFNFEKRN
ncbi:MAG: N-6 DNA methylase, partial [Nanoarchaeota archaeon]|nr:N-6 DNA methylase [Nanoarchaeota archaeon]